MWQNLIQQLNKTTGDDNDQRQFQICKIAIPFTWGVSTNQPYPLEYWNFCNQLLPWSNSNVYFPSIGSFESSYKSWLNLLTQKTNLEKNYLSQVQQAHLQLDMHALNLTNQYKSYRQGIAKMQAIPKNFHQWKASNNQKKLVTLRNNIDALVQKPSSINNGPPTKYTQVWAAFNNSSNFRFYIDSSFQVHNKRIYNWAESPISIQRHMRSSKRVKIPISVTVKKHTNNFIELRQGSLTDQRQNLNSPKLPFLRSIKGTNLLPKNIGDNLAPSQFSGSLEYEDTLEVGISPSSKWFIESFLKDHMDGPYNNPNVVAFGNQASANETYFFDGEKAILPSYITSITIGFNPSFSLSGNRQHLSLINKAINETGGIYLGPTPFRMNQINLNNLSNNIISSNNTNKNPPAIIGVNLKFFRKASQGK